MSALPTSPKEAALVAMFLETRSRWEVLCTAVDAMEERALRGAEGDGTTGRGNGGRRRVGQAPAGHTGTYSAELQRLAFYSHNSCRPPCPLIVFRPTHCAL